MKDLQGSQYSAHKGSDLYCLLKSEKEALDVEENITCF